MNRIGEWGERVAEKFLQSKGYKILDRNFVVKFMRGPQRAEIDIIARKGDLVVFFEVKTQADSSRFMVQPEQKVNFQKRAKIIQAAQIWLTQHHVPLNSRWQVDVITVQFSPTSSKAKVQHFQNI